MNIADTDNWKIKHLLEKVEPMWALAVVQGNTRINPPESDPHAATLRELVAKYDVDSVLREILLQIDKLHPADYDSADPIAVANAELANLAANPMPPVTISEVAAESRGDEPVTITELDDEVDPWVADHDLYVTEERDKLTVALERALADTALATHALRELVGPAYDVEYAEGAEGDDMRDHLANAARELRAAARIAAKVAGQ